MTDSPEERARDRRTTIILGIPAWITLVVVVALHACDQRTAAKRDALVQRREALFAALEVIDLVHANTQFDGMPAPTGKAWDITKARQAMNGMLVHCADPERTLKAFYKAIGLHEPLLGQKAPPISTADLNAFRNEVSRELELPQVDYTHLRAPWILSLSGAK